VPVFGRGRETPAAYNQRLLLAFSHQQLQPWPYSGPILLQELATQQASVRSGLIIDRWCVIGKLRQEEDCEPVVEQHATGFDLDTYNILKSYLATKLQQLSVQILSRQQAENLGLA
jgi:DNA polymerase-3 subunit epsilon